MKKITSLSSIVFTIFLMVLWLMPAPSAYAAGNTFYLTPGSSQMNIGTSFEVKVRGYVEEGTTGRATGAVIFPSNLLSVSATSSAGSDYGSPSITPGNGVINFNAAKTPTPTGQVLIMTITFKATAAGTANIGFSDGSSLNNKTTGRSNASFNIIDPNPPKPNPTPTPTPTPTPKPNPTPTPTPTPNPTPEEPVTPEEEEPTVDASGVVSGVSIVTNYSGATINWKLAAGAAGDIFYGPSRQEATTKLTPTKKDDGSFEASINGMKPGVRAYFSINGKAADGKESSYTGSFTTRGYPVVIAVRIGESPASDAKVKIGQKTYAVANTGTLSLTLAEGNYTGSISSGSETKSINFSVAPKEIPAAGPPEQQTFSFSLAGTGVQDSEKSNSSTSILMFVGVLIGGSLLLGAAVMVFMVYRRRHLEAGFNSSSMGSSVVIDDGYDWKSYQKRVQEEAAQLDSSAEQTTPFDTPSSTGYGYTPVAPPTNPSALKPGFDDEIPKDMFEIAKEKELQEKNPQS